MKLHLRFSSPYPAMLMTGTNYNFAMLHTVSTGRENWVREMERYAKKSNFQMILLFFSISHFLESNFLCVCTWEKSFAQMKHVWWKITRTRLRVNPSLVIESRTLFSVCANANDATAPDPGITTLSFFRAADKRDKNSHKRQNCNVEKP